MKLRLLAIGLLALGLVGAGSRIERANAQEDFRAGSVQFAAIEVFVDSAEPLAAWQFELTESTGSMTVVGIENGDSAAYGRAPRYDLDAVAENRADRIVVADYSLANRDALPSGRTRIATVHVRLMGTQAPDFKLNLIAAGNADGRPIAAVADLELDGRTE